MQIPNTFAFPQRGLRPARARHENFAAHVESR